MGDFEKKDDHESPADHMIHQAEHATGYKGYIVMNNDGVLLRYNGFSQPEALQLAYSAISLYQKSKSTTLDLLGKEDGAVESVRIRSKKDELIMTQHGNFTFIVRQSFMERVMEEGEDGAAAPDPGHEE